MSRFDELQVLIEHGEMESVVAAVETALARGIPAQEILQDGLMAAMEVVGAKMGREEMYIPEVLHAAKAMEAGLAVLQPQLTTDQLELSGTVVIGTVKGDMHDIGKNLVALLLESAGFSVIDLGIDVDPTVFVDAVRQHQPDFVAMSALLTTTMPMMVDTIAALTEAGLRGDVKVLVGGACVTQEYATQIGADGYGYDAGAAIRVAKELKA